MFLDIIAEEEVPSVWFPQLGDWIVPLFLHAFVLLKLYFTVFLRFSVMLHALISPVPLKGKGRP